jgi:purine nucleoside permease
MRLLGFEALLLSCGFAGVALSAPNPNANGPSKRWVNGKIAPKVVIISQFEPEAAAWWGIPEFDLFGNNITFPGLSPEFPDIHCTESLEICQIVIGEAG